MPKPNHKKELERAFGIFVEYTAAGRLSRGLRTMFLLLLEYEEGLVPHELKDLPFDMLRLFDLLDAVEAAKTTTTT